MDSQGEGETGGAVREGGSAANVDGSTVAGPCCRGVLGPYALIV